MLKKLLMISVLVFLMFAFVGCKKTTDDKVGSETTSKSMAEYQTEAKSQINKDNMSSELDKLEKLIEVDANMEK
jgi:competence protein ComGC